MGFFKEKKMDAVNFVVNTTPEPFCASDYYEIDGDGNTTEIIPYDQWPDGLKSQFS